MKGSFWIPFAFVVVGVAWHVQTQILGIPNEITASGLILMAATNPLGFQNLNVTLVPLGVGTNGPNFTCPGPLGIYEDPKDCTNMYVCALGLVKLKLHCTSGHFAPSPIALCFPNTPESDERCDKCTNYTTPSTCTRSPYHYCSFCYQSGFSNSSCPRHRCGSYSRLRAAGCPDSKIYNGTNSGSTDESRVIDPSSNATVEPVHITLAPGDTRNLSITFKLANIPLDLYLLLDISGSMNDDKSTIADLTSNLTALLANLTNDYTMGFGAFSDRYFENILSLSSNTSGFESAVQSSPLFGGFDPPEDAGTGLFEVAKCLDQIGWRSNSRRIILDVTDDTFHFGPDYSNSYFGAVVPPFNGTICNLDPSTGVYNQRLPNGTYLEDYPTASDIQGILKAESISVIFAIAPGSPISTPINTTLEFYANFTQNPPYSSVGTLSTSSSDLPVFLDQAYRTIASRVSIQNSPVTDEVKITYFSTCAGTISLTETSVCEGLPVGAEVTFIVQIGLETCPANPADWNQSISFSAENIPGKVDVSLDLVCGDWD